MVSMLLDQQKNYMYIQIITGNSKTLDVSLMPVGWKLWFHTCSCLQTNIFSSLAEKFEILKQQLTNLKAM